MYLLSRSIECSVSCIDGNYNMNDQQKSPNNDLNEWYTRPKARQLPVKLLHCLYIEMQTFPYLPGSLYEVSRVQWPQTNCIKPTTIKRKNGKCILACRQTEYFGYTKTPRFKLLCWKEILALGTYHVKKEKEKQKQKVYTNRNNLISFFLAFR